MSRTAGLRDGRPLLDRRSGLELGGVFLLLSVLCALLSIDLVRSILEDPGLTPGTLVAGGMTGIGIALGLTALLLLSWRQGPGRLGQRLGRRAWRQHRLPAVEPDRHLAIADLRRRAQGEGGGVATTILAGFSIFIAVLQVVGSTSWIHAVAWLLLAALVGAVAVRAVLDRRRLPQLRLLLGQAEPHDHR